MGFTKLDDGIIYSSIMGEDDSVFRVWIILLASCKSTGVSPLSPVFIKNITGKSLDEINRCISILESPDLSSRSINDEGRRIRKIDGGYEIINYRKYRDFTYSDSPEAIKKRRQRSGDIPGHVPDISGHSASASVSVSVSEREEVQEKSFKNRHKKFCDEIAAFEKYPELMRADFILYWTEPNKSKSKMRFELEKTWDAERRLKTWENNQSKFDKNKTVSNQKKGFDAAAEAAFRAKYKEGSF